MAELSDIEEGCSSDALEENGNEQIGNVSSQRIESHHSNHHQKSPALRINSHELPSSSPSSSSSRTITPPDRAPPQSPHRASSSGTVQIVSPGANSFTGLSQTESSAWSPVSQASRNYGRTPESYSSATFGRHDHHGYNRPQQQQSLGVPGRVGRPDLWRDSSPVDSPRHGDDEQDYLLDYAGRERKEGNMQEVLNTVMHGVVLALQSGVSLVVLSFLAWMALWKDEEDGLDGIHDGMLRNVSSLAAIFVLLLSFVTLLVHEVYILSSVVLLYLQAVILALTTVSATAMGMDCLQEDNFMLKCVMISCSILFWGTSGLAFLRAVVIWKITNLGEEEASGGWGGVRGRYAATQG
ncbi:hypothetical protein V8C35DRAFT_281702 [Trichoderma chlorosporum]